MWKSSLAGLVFLWGALNAAEPSAPPKGGHEGIIVFTFLNHFDRSNETMNSPVKANSSKTFKQLC